VFHPSGKFVYGSNRGYHTIAGFKVDASNGRLMAIGQFAQGTLKTPRNFNIDPTGRMPSWKVRTATTRVVPH